MRSIRRQLLFASLAWPLAGCRPPAAPPVPARLAAAPPPALRMRVSAPFRRNGGLFPPEARLYAAGPGTAVLFEPAGMVFLAGEPAPSDAALRLRFDGAGGREGPEGGERIASETGPPAYAALSYRELYAGIDLVLRIRGGGPALSFMVNPGVDPAAIRLRSEGAPLLPAPDGSLRIPTPFGDFAASPPRAHQYRSGEKAAIPARYRLDGARTAGFDVPRRDPRYLLVIEARIEPPGGGAP